MPIEPTWGAMKYVRQNEVSLLGPEDAAVITKARDMYGEAVEASTEAALAGHGGVVGDSVRQAYAQVNFFVHTLLRDHNSDYNSCGISRQCKVWTRLQ